MRIKAVAAAARGGPNVLSLGDVDLAWPRHADDVLVRLAAAGLNPADGFFRQLGGYIDGPQPLVLGHDGAGTVEAVGDGVPDFAPGERVCFCNGGIGGDLGTYAEFAVVPAVQLAKLPGSVDFTTAAALPLVAITAWESLYQRAGLAAGERALIHAGAGGTGHIAVQLAKLAGAHVAATVSSDEKAAFVARLGADQAIDYRALDFVEACGGGIDVALDNVGAETLKRTYRAMAPYGRIVTLMGSPGDDDDLTAYNMNLAIINEMMLTPMWKGLRGRLAAQAGLVREALTLVQSGRLTVHVSQVFELNDIQAAHASLDRGGTMGKIVLRIAG